MAGYKPTKKTTKKQGKQPMRVDVVSTTATAEKVNPSMRKSKSGLKGKQSS